VTATLFDFNGVLVDDEHVHLASFREVLEPLGVFVTDAEYNEKYLGFDDAGAFRAILQDHRVSEALVDELILAKKPVYMRRIETDLRIFDGAVDIVRRRAELGPVGIVSGALRHEIEHALTKMGVRQLVSFIVSAEDTRACKPDPEGYALAVSRLGTRAVVVEDSIAGVEAARSARLRCAAVTHSYPRLALERAGADVVVDALADLDDRLLEGDG
jgi:beta-phosphoglucomutase